VCWLHGAKGPFRSTNRPTAPGGLCSTVSARRSLRVLATRRRRANIFPPLTLHTRRADAPVEFDDGVLREHEAGAKTECAAGMDLKCNIACGVANPSAVTRRTSPGALARIGGGGTARQRPRCVTPDRVSRPERKVHQWPERKCFSWRGRRNRGLASGRGSAMGITSSLLQRITNVVEQRGDQSYPGSRSG
jgi:hypothetical protein